ncbi:hypothetical protein RND71_030461 [Anisodus tanguticus]|uniref:Uncharacterized protein n=1 Tax=Anisodus tanguticus TaxID=243964 RepID=A0AAE1RGG5_9SOLA|nr:hypothetical protein RND71_030461 [Anisodus tanguticus]
METATAFSIGYKPTKASLGGSDLVRFGSQLRMSPSGIKLYPSISRVKLSNRKAAFVSKKYTAIRASVSPSESGGSSASIDPLHLESPIGQSLSDFDKSPASCPCCCRSAA